MQAASWQNFPLHNRLQEGCRTWRPSPEHGPHWGITGAEEERAAVPTPRCSHRNKRAFKMSHWQDPPGEGEQRGMLQRPPGSRERRWLPLGGSGASPRHPSRGTEPQRINHSPPPLPTPLRRKAPCTALPSGCRSRAPPCPQEGQRRPPDLAPFSALAPSGRSERGRGGSGAPRGKRRGCGGGRLCSSPSPSSAGRAPRMRRAETKEGAAAPPRRRGAPPRPLPHPGSPPGPCRGRLGHASAWGEAARRGEEGHGSRGRSFLAGGAGV